MAKSRVHKWSEDDDVIALYLYRMHRDGAPPLELEEKEIAEVLDMTRASLVMRRGNFGFLDGKAGLSHPAEQSRLVYDRYKDATNAELRSIAVQLLETKIGR
jgi:hypothetical protein